jgi:hypothetical protein
LRKSGKSAEEEFVGSFASRFSLLANGFAVSTSEYRVLCDVSAPVDGLDTANIAMVVAQDQCRYLVVGK